MTTIAYKEGVIAYDSRSTSRDIIFDDAAEKHYEIKGVHFFMAGNTAHYEEFFTAWFSNNNACRNLDIAGLVFEEGKLYKPNIETNGEVYAIAKHPIRPGNSVAIGSGADFALAFMYTGLSAEQAVGFTMRLDPFTGGNVNKFLL